MSQSSSSRKRQSGAPRALEGAKRTRADNAAIATPPALPPALPTQDRALQRELVAQRKAALAAFHQQWATGGDADSELTVENAYARMSVTQQGFWGDHHDFFRSLAKSSLFTIGGSKKNDWHRRPVNILQGQPVLALAGVENSA